MSEAIFNFHDTLLLATAFQSFLFALLILIGKRDPHASDYFLIGFFLAQTLIPIHLLITYGEEFRFIALAASPKLFHAFDFAFWIEGQLLLWFTRSLLYKEFKLKGTDVLFLAPVFIYLIFSLSTFYSWDSSAKVEYIEEYWDSVAPSQGHILEAVRAAVFVFFSVLCLFEIRHAQQQLHHRYSNIEKIDFVWLGSLVFAFMILRSWMFIVVGIAFVSPDLGSSVFNLLGLAGNYLMFAMISVLIYFSLTRTGLFAGKLSKTSLHTHSDEHQIDPLLTKKIEQHMDQNKPYLSHYLNLEELAKQLSMHPRALSVTIKHQFDTNFYEFINTYRIEEAKRLISDPERANGTMLEILGESGFNSKATFNSFFKKMVGMTPTQYKASLASEKQ